MEVESGDRAPRALPRALGASDEDDRPPVALDQPRRDDADHALVPALVGEDVGAAGPLLGRPGLDPLRRLAKDPLLHLLAIPVQFLQAPSQPGGLGLALGEEKLEGDLWTTEATGSV
ncbi:MAG: hypothetical protein C4305_02945, partial [Thermoleophilia bacterium]